MADAKLQYVISDERPIGFLLSCTEGWKSYDTDGRPIGLFDSEELAGVGGATVSTTLSAASEE